MTAPRYTIEVVRRAQREIRKLSRANQERVRKAILDLAQDPRPEGARKLQGSTEPLYRIRTGDYRVIYEVQDDRLIVLVVRVRHRREAYR